MAADDPIEGEAAAPGTSPLDGRSARRVRTRARIIAALRDLVVEGQARPTAESIAQRVEVSLRTIYQHFSDLNDLFSGFAAESLRSAQSSAAPPHVATEGGGADVTSASGHLEARIASVVLQRDRLYADIGASARLAFALENESAEVAQALQAIRNRLREDVTETFAAELASVAACERDERLEACMALLSFSSYDLLRVRQGLSRDRYLSTLRVALRRLLTP